MLTKKQIENGTIVYNSDNRQFFTIQDVGNARKKGDRSISTTQDDELSYSLVDIITEKIHDGICEYSHMTSELLTVASIEDVEIHLLYGEADALRALAKAKKQYELIKKAINKFHEKSWN